MQYCFINSDKEALANVLNKMPKDLADYHMQRCIESGLWIPTWWKIFPNKTLYAIIRSFIFTF